MGDFPPYSTEIMSPFLIELTRYIDMVAGSGAGIPMFQMMVWEVRKGRIQKSKFNQILD